MRQFNVLFRWGWTFLVVVTLGLAGCDGDDGAAGAAGAAGPPGGTGDPGPAGPPGPGASITPLESCGVCHDDGSIADAAAAHALPPIESVSNVAFAVNGLDLDVTFDLAADGEPATGYDQAQRGYRTDGLTRTDVCNSPDPRGGIPCLDTSMTLTENATPGNYTIKVLGEAAAAATNNRWLFRVGFGSDRSTRVYFYGDTPATPVEIEAPVVSAAACNACHGPERLSGVHGGYYPAAEGVEPCQVCHGVEDPDAPGELVPSLAAVAHGYHSSIESWKDPVEEIEPHVTYPTYINNCSVCHSEAAQLTAANAMPVSGAGCFTCHGSINSDSFDFTGLGFHLTLPDPKTADCQLCHADPAVGGFARATVAEFHNGSITERDGVIWNGEDTSVTEGAKIAWTITGVTDDGTDLTITWEASYDGVAFSPCNADPAAGPVFFADADPAATPPVDNGDNLSILRNYAQGEDFILGIRGDRPQPGSTPGVSAANTSCDGSGLVATTVVPVEDTAGTAAAAATVGRVAIQGKPRVLNVDPTPDPDFAGDYGPTMPVRAKTPTYDWVIGDATGLTAAPVRRAVADTSLCLSCHVGSLYQHGGNRVDNIDMCYLCHNAAANDEYVRVDSYGVDPSEAYDGRAGQAFGIKEMVHAVHPAGELGNPVVIYRGRGIYGWADDVSKLSNWPLVDDCVRSNGSPGRLVVGADDPTAASACQPHIFHSPTYPRGLYDCAACHVANVDILPDPTKAMATTVESGAPPFGHQLNDVLEGVQTSSCVTCHADSASKGHAYQNSWTPQAFPEGRQTIIDAN